MATILQNHYVLAVHDVHASAQFYTDVLGFEITRPGDDWIFVRKDNCQIMLGECPYDLHPRDLGCHNYFAYLRVDDVDGYFEQISHRGADLLSRPTDQPWGMREFGIRSPDGHRLMIGQSIEGAPTP